MTAVGHRTEQLRGDEVAATAGGEQLDDLRVGRGDQEDRGNHRHDEEDRKMAVRTKLQEALFRAVCRR